MGTSGSQRDVEKRLWDVGFREDLALPAFTLALSNTFRANWRNVGNISPDNFVHLLDRLLFVVSWRLAVLDMLSDKDNVAALLPEKFVSILLRRSEGRSLNLNPEVVAEAFMSVEDPLVIVCPGDLRRIHSVNTSSHSVNVGTILEPPSRVNSNLNVNPVLSALKNGTFRAEDMIPVEGEHSKLNALSDTVDPSPQETKHSVIMKNYVSQQGKQMVASECSSSKTKVEQTEVKLVDVLEMNFTSADQPHPRGEIYVRRSPNGKVNPTHCEVLTMVCAQTFAPLPDSGSAVPLLLHNVDELYDSSTSCWNPAIRNESNACIELFASFRSLCKVAVEADANSLAIERNLSNGGVSILQRPQTRRSVISILVHPNHGKFTFIFSTGGGQWNFNGIKLSSSLSISHLFYADDAVFIGQWCDGNISTLIHVLECFYRASGLRINMSKSKILGVNVDSDKVKGAASKLGCLILKTPFTYLGSKVGGSMSRVHAWNEVIDRVKNRLSKWKMKTLSIGGRLTLLKSVLGSIPIFHMSIYRAPLSVLRTLESIRSKFFKGHDINSNKASWVNWKKVLASKEKGGLGVSSLFALNRGLMFKWIWRFYTQNTLLWVRVIKAIHGDDGNVGGHVKSGAKSCCLESWKLITVGAKLAQPSLEYSIRRNPRGGVEHDQFNELSALVHDVSLIPMSDRFFYSLPTRFNVSRRGIDIDSIMCAICDNGVETSRHLFFYCCMVRQIVRKITRWWDVPYVEVESYEDWYNWLVNLRISSMHKQMFEGIDVMRRLVVAKRTSALFDDPTMEIQELTAVIKQDITALNSAVVELQLVCNSQNEGENVSSDTTTHSTTVVDNLKNRLMSTTKEFKEVLTMRTENLKVNENRKQLFSSKKETANPFVRQRPLANKSNASSSSAPPPWANESSSSSPLFQRKQADADSQPLLQQQNQQQQQQMVPLQDSYMQSRAEALHNVESTIHELGNIFTQLATMVSQQGELAISVNGFWLLDRIDENMEDTLANVEGAQGQLMSCGRQQQYQMCAGHVIHLDSEFT
ncbi:RNA-directed DNA polymerase, eukaryota, reverse transcriptase zinc-binding domain protein [Tanacetum coccineum]|uniref:RNA-directed DNA polymerase, eukaryota, reverse transcriptase zinc-binding domain protein n=1 Tax=Tanacetum coccineum TaxID=301880 RepID=A0ABQ5DWM4_9ASTR